MALPFLLGVLPHLVAATQLGGRHDHAPPPHPASPPSSDSASHNVPGAGHSHSHTHAAPKLALDEAEIARWHGVYPPSYYTHDWPTDGGEGGLKGLMILHVVLACVAFFGVLPIAIALRSSQKRLASLAHILFLITALLSWAAALAYKRGTPDLYTPSSHSILGIVTTCLAAGLTAIDHRGILARFLAPLTRLIKPLVTRLRPTQSASTESEYVGLTSSAPAGAFVIGSDEEEGQIVLASPAPHSPTQHSPTSYETYTPATPTSAWSNEHRRGARHVKRHSNHSESTLHDESSRSSHDHSPPPHSSKPSSSRRAWIARAGFLLLESAHRLLVPLALVQVISGIAIYTGACRGGFINGCAAHLIKGGIFWCYGVLTFCRYVGAYADLGWAWNRVPTSQSNSSTTRKRKPPTAELVESSVILLYGATNTWMERFGSEPGAPLTTKELQHISIAVMFWFAGALGVAVELESVRKWLGAEAVQATLPPPPSASTLEPSYTDSPYGNGYAGSCGEAYVEGKNAEKEAAAVPRIEAPPSYAASFNPFPALVIGITGVAMSAHHQEYVFQVQIHALWGTLLTLFAVLRSLTYFFLFLRPPKSVLPSRPPTEALAGFFLAGGGLVFMFSTEEVTFWAMRTGYDDMMMFLNLAVAITCLTFCWAVALIALKGWAITRAMRQARAAVATDTTIISYPTGTAAYSVVAPVGRRRGHSVEFEEAV